MTFSRSCGSKAAGGQVGAGRRQQGRQQKRCEQSGFPGPGRAGRSGGWGFAPDRQSSRSPLGPALRRPFRRFCPRGTGSGPPWSPPAGRGESKTIALTRSGGVGWIFVLVGMRDCRLTDAVRGRCLVTAAAVPLGSVGQADSVSGGVA